MTAWGQKIQLGRETTAGTAVAATTIWRGPFGGIKDDRVVSFVDENPGIAIPTDSTYIAQLAASLAMPAGPASFEQVNHIFEAGVKNVNTGSADGSGSGKIYSYDVGLAAVNTIRTYTLETGDAAQAEEMEYSFVTDFTLSGQANDAVQVSANWMGRQASNVSFTGALSVPTVERILAPLGSLYIDAASGTHGTTQVSTTLLSWSLAVKTGWRTKHTVDLGQKYFAYHYFDRSSFEAVLDVVYEHDSNGLAEKAAWRAETARLIQLNIGGSALTTAGTDYSTKALVINLTGKYETFEALGNQDGNSIIAAKFRVGYNPTDASGLTFIVVNELTTVP